MKASIAHKVGMNQFGVDKWPDGLVQWCDATPPEKSGGIRTGHLRSCGYCGSMHPADVAFAIRSGAEGHWADKKYGWPHKAYFEKIPNPHAGLLEVRSAANFKPKGCDDWIQVGEKQWHEPPKPANSLTNGKFYSVHLMDASPEDRETIERHLGLHFDFSDDGKVSWEKIK